MTLVAFSLMHKALAQTHARHAACIQASGRDDEKKKKLPMVTLTLVSFSTTRKAYERICARFAREYQAATGQPVRFRLSFGGSGTQARPTHVSVLYRESSKKGG